MPHKTAGVTILIKQVFIIERNYKLFSMPDPEKSFPAKALRHQ
jgi:hypothetical protein